MFPNIMKYSRLFFIATLGWAILLTNCRESINPVEHEVSATVSRKIDSAITETMQLQPTLEYTPTSISTAVSTTPPPTTTILSTLTDTPRPTLTATRSPITGRVVFSSRRQDTNGDGVIDKQDGVHLYSIDLLSRELTQLTFGDQRDLRPSWSPDGKQIAFVSNREGSYKLYVMNADGSEIKRLTDGPEEESKPKWSPDGTKIVYVQVKTVEYGLQEKRLCLISTTGGDIQQLTIGPGNDDNPDWSPDGRYIAFDRTDTNTGGGVHLLDVETGQEYTLTTPTTESRNVTFDGPLWLPRDGYYLSLIQVPGDLSSVGIKVFELLWEDTQPVLHRVFTIADGYGWLTWGANGEWLIGIIPNCCLPHETWPAEARHELTLLPIDFSTQRPALTADPAARSSYSYSLYDNGELLTNDTFFDDYPDWSP